MTTIIHIEIERLVLDGWPLDQHQAQLVQAAIETELSRQMSVACRAEPFGSSSALDYAATQPVNWNNASGPANLGTQLGQAISGSIVQ